MLSSSTVFTLRHSVGHHQFVHPGSPFLPVSWQLSRCSGYPATARDDGARAYHRILWSSFFGWRWLVSRENRFNPSSCCNRGSNPVFITADLVIKKKRRSGSLPSFRFRKTCVESRACSLLQELFRDLGMAVHAGDDTDRSFPSGLSHRTATMLRLLTDSKLSRCALCSPRGFTRRRRRSCRCGGTSPRPASTRPLPAWSRHTWPARIPWSSSSA